MFSLKKKLGVKYLAIISYTGFLMIALGVVLLIPLLALLFHPAESDIIHAFLFPSGGSILAGVFLWRVFRPKESSPLSTPDAAVIVTLIWIIAVLVGAMPFTLSGTLSPIDGIFETMSGWTTTGLTMVNPDNTPGILLMWRSLMQFVGGAGLAVVMLSAIIGSLGPGIYEAEARTDHLLPHVTHTARMIIKIYIGYYIMGVGLYLLSGLNLFDALCHTMSGLATGGFSTHSESIAYWNSHSVEIVSIFLMILGTINFATHHAILSSKGKKGFKDAEIVLMLWLIISATLLLFTHIPETQLGIRLRESVFQVTSALSGTGYSTVNLTAWGELPLFIITILMLIEGGTGSTAGGIKLYRIHIIMKSIWWWIKKQFYPPSAVIQRTVWRRGEKLEIQDKHIQAVAAFIGIYLLTYTLGVLVFLIDGFSLRESMFEFASAIGTVGLSLGITGPEMPIASKIAQILGMWLGRLEFIAIFHAFIRLGRDIFK